MSQRGQEWMDFSKLVYNHIEKYAVPQYGDKGKDPVSSWTRDQYMESIYKYYKRYKTNSREGQEKLDLFKIAHFACLSFFKLDGDDNKTSKIITGSKEDLINEIKDLDNDQYTIEIRNT